MNPPTFFAGLDLGKRQDYTAFAVVECHRTLLGRDPVTWAHVVNWDLRVRRLTRFPLGTSYRELLTLIEHQMRTPAFGTDTPLVIDVTGVGEVMFDLLKGSALPLVPVSITAGDRAAWHDGRWHVPKQQLVETLAVLIEQRKLQVAAQLPLAEVLLQELAGFEAGVKPSGYPVFDARAGLHDDLVTAVALACWYCRRQYRDLATGPGPPYLF